MRGGILNKRAFIKTPEAILSALLVFGMMAFISEKVYTPLIIIEADTSIIQNSILDLLGSEIGRLLDSCDLQRIQYLVHKFQPTVTESKIVLYQVSDIDVESQIPLESQIISFSYNFPSYVDLNSVLVYSEDQDFLTDVAWNWKATPIIIYNNQSRKVNYDFYFENVTMVGNDIVNESLLFYWKSQETPINLSGFSDKGTYSVANISVRIPLMDGGESGTGYLLFALDNTTFTQSYVNLSKGTGFEYTVSNSIYSTRGDVKFRILDLNTSETVYLYYSIGTENNVTYFPITETVNNSYVSFTIHRDDLKICTPIRAEQNPASDYNAVKKMFFGDHLSSIIEFIMWYNL